MTCAKAPTDEGAVGAGTFLADLNADTASIVKGTATSSSTFPASLFRLSDASGQFTLTPVTASPPRLKDLSSADIFILDDTGDPVAPTVYAWIGKEASAGERRMGVHFAQTYLRGKEDPKAARTSVVKINEGRENEAFLRAFR